jgi:FkbM family methyltransferase
MKELAKSIVYGGFDLVTGGRGVERNIGNEKIRFPTRYSRYYPRDYEPELFKFLYEFCTPGSCFLDCGAHFGLFSVVAARLVGDGGKVIGFEPAPRIRSIYEHVVQLNRRDNVEIRSEAVSSGPGTATFFDTGAEASNANSLAKQDRHSGGYEVETTSIDRVMANRDVKVTAMKIDVEGAEYGALNGAAETLNRHRLAIFLSLHPTAISKMDASLGEIWDFLIEHDFEMENLDHPVSREWFVDQTELFDVVCRPISGAGKTA